MRSHGRRGRCHGGLALPDVDHLLEDVRGSNPSKNGRKTQVVYWPTSSVAESAKESASTICCPHKHDELREGLTLCATKVKGRLGRAGGRHL